MDNGNTIGFARRMTEYKRAELIFSDLEMLRKVNKRGKIQLIFAGKAHLSDEVGKQIIKNIFKNIGELANEIKIFFSGKLQHEPGRKNGFWS